MDPADEYAALNRGESTVVGSKSLSANLADHRLLIIQVAKFLLVGLMNTAVGLGCIYAAMYFFGLGPVQANVVGYAVGMVVSYLLNSIWTFKAGSPAARSIARYLGVVAVSYLLNLTVVFVATRYFHLNPYLVQLLGIAPYTACMFIGCRLYVFNPSSNLKRS